MGRKTLTTGDIADYCGVNFRTVIRWIERGYITAHKLPGRGDHRVLIDDFVDFLGQNSMPIPEEFQTKNIERRSQNIPRGILVIDDDPAMANAIARAIKKCNRPVDIANNGFEAGLKVAQQKPELITLDLKMINMSGIEVISLLRNSAYTEGIPILVVSGDINEGLDEAMKAGANDFLEKPFENETLLAKVENLLQQKQPNTD